MIPSPIQSNATSGTAPGERVEPIIWLLFGAVVFFAVMLIAVSKLSPNDGQTFQVISSLLTGFAGALFMRIKPADQKPKVGTVGDVQHGDVNITTETPIK